LCDAQKVDLDRSAHEDGRGAVVVVVVAALPRSTSSSEFGRRVRISMPRARVPATKASSPSPLP